MYFVIRNDGSFMVRHRGGPEVHTIQDWTPHPAVARHTGDGGPTVKNVLAVDVGRDAVRFFVNGQEVTSFPTGPMRTDGVVGLRVNHRLNLHVSRLEVGR
jgi:hypothetical protein